MDFGTPAEKADSRLVDSTPASTRQPERSRHVRLLHIEDCENDHVLIVGQIQRAGYTVTTRRVDSLRDLRTALTTATWDIIVSDYRLPGFDALATLAEVRAWGGPTPCVVISGTIGEETAVACMRAGAHDYIMKGSLSRLVPVLEREIHDAEERVYEENLKKQAQQELARKNEDLSRALVQLKDAQARMIQQERLSALGRMASGIAHDFNNMLMPIVGLTELLLSDPGKWSDRTETAGMLVAINTSAHDAADVVKRLREFYRPDQELETERLDVAALFRDVATTTRPAWKTQKEAESTSIHLVQVVTSGMAVTGNRSQLREALTNLVLNAVDAMPDGGTITLQAREEQDSWLLSVVDTGTGMPPHVVERCMEPFFSTKGERGTGMGLAMVHGIAERHGGTLDIESAVGQGTKITIKLPRLEPVPTATQAEAPRRALITRTQNLDILVVDDEERARRLLKRLLQYAEHKVQVAEDMTSALALYGKEHFDLVITDRAMPGGSGDELALELRKRGATLPIILLTGLGDFMQYRNETPEGIDLVLSKPIGNEDLLAGIQSVLRGG